MERVKISDIVDIINDSVNPYEGERAYLSTGDLDSSIISNLEYHSFDEKPSRANLNVKEGDIIVARMQGTNKVKVIDKSEENIIVSTGFLVLRAKENSNINYLFHFFKSDNFQNDKDSLCTGATQKAINNSNFVKIQIPLPPLEQQKAIAERLDKAQEIIQLNEQEVEKYTQLSQALFIDMFGDPVTNPKGWEKKKLGEVSLVKTGPFGSLLHVEDYIKGGIPLVNPSHINRGKIKKDDNFTISQKKAMGLKNYILREHDLILGRRGEMGKCAIVKEKESGYLCGTGSLFIRLKMDLNRIFSYYIIISKSFIELLENSAKGVTMKNLNSKIVSNLEIPIPPLKLQNEFAERIEQIEHLKSIAEKDLAQSQDLFNSLLQESFQL